jgi:hypothetical protein
VKEINTIPSENNLESVVKVVHWKVRGVDGDLSAELNGSIALNKPDPVNFVPFEEITEEEVISWVKGTIGEDMTAAAEADVAAQILYKTQQQPVASPLPWA